MDDFNCAKNRLDTLAITVPAAPQGRLTLTSGAPVMTADVVAATTVYYTPYVGNVISINSTGGAFAAFKFPELTLSTSGASLAANALYDVFVFLNSGAPAIGVGPAWASLTGRGSGAGSTNLTLFDGLWTNANGIVLKNGSTTYSSTPQRRATYVGTIATTSVAGQVTMQFKPPPASGGNNTWLGVWNAYNRTTVRARSTDSTANWTYNSASPRISNGSAANRINWVDGLGQSQAVAQFNQVASTQGNGASAALGWDSTTPQGLTGTTQNGNASAIVRNAIARDAFIALGFHYVQGLESAPSGTLEIKLDM
jgi:hypothetical protein